MVNSQFEIRANVFLYEFPAHFTYQDYLVLKKYPEQLRPYLRDKGHNLVVDTGLQLIADSLVGDDDDSLTHCAVGTGTNTPAAGQTALQTETGSRVAITDKYRSGQTANFDTFYSTSDANATWEETGLFDASSSGVMFCRRTFSSSFTKSTSNTAIVAWVITLAAVAD